MDDFWGKGITKPQTLLWPLSPGTDGQGQMGGGESGVEVGSGEGAVYCQTHGFLCLRSDHMQPLNPSTL